MSSLEQLYQQVILDHAREKHGSGLREPAPGSLVGESRQYNPLCGDEVMLRVDLVVAAGTTTDTSPDIRPDIRPDISPDIRPDTSPDTRPDITPDGTGEDDVVRDLSWVGEGCSISQAATSVLHDLVVGRSVGQAAQVIAAFREMIRSRGTVTPDEEVLGDAAAFSGVGRHANRVKCAMLGWTAFEAALQEAELVRGRRVARGLEESR